MLNKNKAYACYSIHESIRLKSSSGGLFYLFAKQILEIKGVVYGVTMSEDCKEAYFTRINNIDNIHCLLGSKYLQADLRDSYKKVLNDLLNDFIVLFCGTGCQINGLKNFLEKKLNLKQLENLYCIDIICHGVSSPGLWSKYVSFLENKENSKLISVSFRAKDEGWKNYGMRYKYLDKTKFIPKNEDPYMSMFLKNHSLRPSCYNCLIKENIESDITIGDFWGINNIAPIMNDDKGTSLIVINTSHGDRLFTKIMDDIKFIDVNLEEAIKYNSAYYKSVCKPANRNFFFDDLNTISFIKFLKKYNFKKKISLKKIIKKVFKHK